MDERDGGKARDFQVTDSAPSRRLPSLRGGSDSTHPLRVRHDDLQQLINARIAQVLAYSM